MSQSNNSKQKLLNFISLQLQFAAYFIVPVYNIFLKEQTHLIDNLK